MLSDIHFDPFHDPAKFDRLSAAPVEDWDAILSAAASPTMASAFTHLQATCGSKGIDTPYPLLHNSLLVAHNHLAHPAFITVSGDLMAHAFDCRFHALAPQATEAGYSAFAAKTIAFVALQLRQRFPATPIYLALGNNDSGCADYRETPNSAFLQADAQTFANAAISPANRTSILATFSTLGDYTVQLPAPMAHTRLIVLQDIFDSKKYNTCPGQKVDANMTPSEIQIAWLHDQLTQARDHHEHVWVMAHIPPGIDAYNTLRSGIDVCAGKTPTQFLRSEALADTLAAFPDIIRLALFGHTHMDEIHLIRTAADPKSEGVPTKLVPSISPVDGNNPAFTIAEIEPQTATLKDYVVYAANSQAASAWIEPPAWREEYRYSTAYHLPDFSSASVIRLTNRFLEDKTGTSPFELNFETNYFVNDGSLSATLKAAALQFVWSKYACSLAQSSIAGYTACACPAATPASQP